MSSSAAWLEVPITQSVRYSTILFLQATEEDKGMNESLMDMRDKSLLVPFLVFIWFLDFFLRGGSYFLNHIYFAHIHRHEEKTDVVAYTLLWAVVTDLNFISWQKDRSSRLSIITSTNWHSLVLIWIAWTTFPRMRTYLRSRVKDTEL